MKRIAIFASGSGTNAEAIIKYFKQKDDITVGLVLSNNAKARVLERAKNLNVPTMVFSREDFYKKTVILDKLRDEKIDLIVLAGFLWLVPGYILKAFPWKVLNIHPALLPKYGGRGMYGMHVHEAVVKNKEKTTGITIHYVNEKYDEGAVLFQKSIPLNDTDTPRDVARKVHHLEHRYFSGIIEQCINKTNKKDIIKR